MNKEIINLKNTLPSIGQNSINILGNLVNQYFDYKKDTAMIKYETKKLKEQTKIIIKQIDSKLEDSLNKNNNDFKKEMYRLETIAKNLAENAGNKKIILENISELTKRISNPSTPLSVIETETISKLILLHSHSFQNESNQDIEKLKLMSGFNQNQILMDGE